MRDSVLSLLVLIISALSKNASPFKLSALILLGCSTTKETTKEAINGLEVTAYPNDISTLIHESSMSFPNKTQLSISLISNGKTEFFGVIRKEDTLKAKSNEQLVFEIGSISKVFTSTILANYVEEGIINLDDEVNQYIDFKFKDDLRFTFAVSHTVLFDTFKVRQVQMRSNHRVRGGGRG